MGAYHARIGNIERAKESFQRVIDLNSNDHLAQQARQKLLQLRKLSSGDKNER
jgi:hypothetical protein